MVPSRVVQRQAFRLGVDVGGTFTDIVLLHPDGTLYSKKVPSTPRDYSQAILDGVDVLLLEAGLDSASIGQVVHGTTVATNTIIERKGAKTAVITTKGFRDVLELGRYRLPRLYDFSWRKPEPLVERRYRFEVDERMDHRGEVLRPLQDGLLEEVARKLLAEGIESVAICLLHSYANAVHEVAIARRLGELAPHLSVSTSHQVLPQMQEYERTSTVVINAYVRPVFETYVQALTQRLMEYGIRVPVLIMQSNGGVMTAESSCRMPIYVIESGPAAGAVAAQRLSNKLDIGDLITLDMGGTTAKATILEGGGFTVSPEQEVGGDMTMGHRLLRGGGFIVRVPTIDIAEVGAGGGSIAWVDRGLGLHVGPQSAGAEPGPVCYDRGGTKPTVTDANLVLGYLNQEALLGGALKVNYQGAHQALANLGRELGLSAVETAYGMHAVANSSMIRAVKSVSTERGRDPRRFSLLAFGGNGPVHAVAMAQAMGMKRVIVPPVAGLFSALGLLLADSEHHLVQAFYRPMAGLDLADLNRHFEVLMSRASSLLLAEGFGESKQDLVLHADLQYAGQASSLTIPLPSWPVTGDTLGLLAGSFAVEHENTYGYRSDHESLQFVALKVVGKGVSGMPRLPERITFAQSRQLPRRESRAYFGPRYKWAATPVVPRSALTNEPASGPIIVEEYDCTTVVPPECRVEIDEWGNLIVQVP